MSSTAAVIIFARAKTIFAPRRRGDRLPHLALGRLPRGSVLGFAAWARGVLLLGRHKGWLLRRLPAWLRRPGTAGALGLADPRLRALRRGAFEALGVRARMRLRHGRLLPLLWQAPALWRLSQVGSPPRARRCARADISLNGGDSALRSAGLGRSGARRGAPRGRRRRRPGVAARRLGRRRARSRDRRGARDLQAGARRRDARSFCGVDAGGRAQGHSARRPLRPPCASTRRSPSMPSRR